MRAVKLKLKVNASHRRPEITRHLLKIHKRTKAHSHTQHTYSHTLTHMCKLLKVG